VVDSRSDEFLSSSHPVAASDGTAGSGPAGGVRVVLVVENEGISAAAVDGYRPIEVSLCAPGAVRQLVQILDQGAQRDGIAPVARVNNQVVDATVVDKPVHGRSKGAADEGSVHAANQTTVDIPRGRIGVGQVVEDQGVRAWSAVNAQVA